VKLPEVVGCLHPAHSKSLDLRLSTLKPFNDHTIQVRVYKIVLVLFEYEYIRIYLSIISECPLFMKAPDQDPRRHQPRLPPPPRKSSLRPRRHRQQGPSLPMPGTPSALRAAAAAADQRPRPCHRRLPRPPPPPPEPPCTSVLPPPNAASPAGSSADERPHPCRRRRSRLCSARLPPTRSVAKDGGPVDIVANRLVCFQFNPLRQCVALACAEYRVLCGEEHQRLWL